MKKIAVLALCAATVGMANAQKATVDQAKGLSGKFEKIGDARTLIKQAIENSETSQDANTYYVAGKIEFDAYDNGVKMGLINPEDPSANPVTMGEELLNGYKYFLQALPLDSLPNEKGKIKPKFSGDIISKIAGHSNDFFKAGAGFYEAKRYYPEAYEAFMIYGDMPDMSFLGNKKPQTVPADRGQAYFNAGLAAWSGNEVQKSASAFRAARDMGFDDFNTYIYEIACWQAIAQRDSTMADTAKDKIYEVAKAGNEKFGLSQPVFLNNMINSMVQDGKTNDCLAELDALISENPDNADLYGLKAFVYDRADNDEASIENYKKAASLDNAGFETLRMASRKIFRIGTEKYNNLDMTDREGRQKLKEEYFLPAKEIAEKANSIQGNDSELLYTLDSINYALENYFK